MLSIERHHGAVLVLPIESVSHCALRLGSLTIVTDCASEESFGRPGICGPKIDEEAKGLCTDSNRKTVVVLARGIERHRIVSLGDRKHRSANM